MSATTPALSALAPTVPRSFTSPEAIHLADAWKTSAYDDLCFARKRWILFVQQRDNLPRLKTFASAGFARYPLRAQPVANRTAAVAQQAAGCWRDGTTFVADLKHGGGATMGIAHFAKRVLRLHGLQQQASLYGVGTVDRIAFPATSAAHLAHSWPTSLLRLVAPAAARVPVDGLTAGDGCCFRRVIASAREDTYFVRPEDADVVRTAAHTAAHVPRERAACAPIRACYFQRSEGSSAGRWEGGARLIVNRQEVLAAMARLVAAHTPAGTLALVNVNSSSTFEQQVDTFARCDVLVSVHGSQNANAMFMRPGTAFMELNPHKFFYSSYEALSAVCRVLYAPSRRNSIATPAELGLVPKKAAAFTARASAFTAEFGSWTDVQCQAQSRCRSLSRNFPTTINMTDFELEFARAVRHAAKSFPRPPACPPAAVPPPLPRLDGRARASEATASWIESLYGWGGRSMHPGSKGGGSKGGGGSGFGDATLGSEIAPSCWL